MQQQHLERLFRSIVALSADVAAGLIIHAFFDHVWWLEAVRSNLSPAISLIVEVAFFTFIWRFISTLILGLSCGQYLAALAPLHRGISGRLVLAGSVCVNFILAPLFILELLSLALKGRSLVEWVSGPLLVPERLPKWALHLTKRLVFFLAVIALSASAHGLFSRFFDLTRIKAVEENPFVVNTSNTPGETYSSNRFRVSFTTNLRDNLGVRRLSLIPSFEVVRSLGKKLFYPGLVFFDRENKSFARLGLYKEIDYRSFLARGLNFDLHFKANYPQLSQALAKSGNIEGIRAARDFQDLMMNVFRFDVAPFKSILASPFSSRAYSFILFDLLHALDITFSPKVSRMTLSNESFIRLEGQTATGERLEYWLSTRGPKLRVFSLEIDPSSSAWKTEDVLPIVFRNATWDWQADLAFPIALLKETVNAVSVVDLFTKPNLNDAEKSVIGEFIFFHFFELARESIVLKQVELQALLSDTLERFLVIAAHKIGKEESLYSADIQKNLTDLNLSLKAQDLKYFGIAK